MLEAFKGLMNPFLYIFLFITVGFVLRRMKLLPDNTASVLSSLEIDFIIPGMVLLCFGLQIVIVLLSGPLSKLFVKEGYYRNLYRYQLIYISWGFMGYALIQSLFGAETLYYFILFVLPMNVWTCCLRMRQHGLRAVLRKNVIWQSRRFQERSVFFRYRNRKRI